MQHFLLKQPLEGYDIGDTFYLDNDLRHYIIEVLHIKMNELISISDDCNNSYLCKIKSINKDGVSLEIVSNLYNSTELDFNITLFQGIPKGSKFDTIIQKSVELGVSEIIPLKLKRNVSNIDSKEDKKIQRFQTIADNASNQSKRQKRCIIQKQVDVNEIDLSKFDKVFLAYEDEHDNNIRNYINSIEEGENIAIIIGAEGGFELDEVDMLKSKGAISVTLGKRILRTETAGIAVISLLTLGR